MNKSIIPIAKPQIDKSEYKAVKRVLKSGVLAQGKQVFEFEEQFAKYIGVKQAIATNSGTAALHLALLGLGIGPGDEVITPSFTFIASVNAILFCGSKPVFVDVDPQTFNLDANLIAAKITSKTKAIIVVHLFGLAADMKIINELTKKRHLYVIEDACQAHGAKIDNQKAGSFGEVGCFSFYPTKNMTTGEGGMITTNNQKLADKLRLLRDHGMKIRYLHDILGYNFRLTNIAAALGLSQLKKLDRFNQKRIANAAYYTKKLSGIPGLILPTAPKHYTHVYHQFTIRITKNFPKNRQQIIDALLKNKIGYGIYYPVPVHLQKVYLNLGYEDLLPISEQLANQVLSIPIHPAVTKLDMDRIIKVLLKLNKGNQR